MIYNTSFRAFKLKSETRKTIYSPRIVIYNIMCVRNCFFTQNRRENDLVGGSVSSVSGLMSTSSAHDTDDSKSLSIKDAKSAKILLKATKSIGSFPLLQRTLSYGVSKKKNLDNMDASVIEEDAKQCHVGDRGVELIYDGLCNNAFITDIVLVNSGLTSVGVTLICSAAVTLSNLVYLDLSQNAIDDECANVICQIIYDPEEIVEKVDTMPGMLSPASSKREKVATKPKSTVCKSLQKLSLCGNRFTVVGVKKIVETALQDTCAVAHLRYDNVLYGKWTHKHGLPNFYLFLQYI